MANYHSDYIFLKKKGHSSVTPNVFTLNVLIPNGDFRGLCPLVKGCQGLATDQGIENIAPDEG